MISCMENKKTKQNKKQAVCQAETVVAWIFLPFRKMTFDVRRVEEERCFET